MAMLGSPSLRPLSTIEKEPQRLTQHFYIRNFLCLFFFLVAYISAYEYGNIFGQTAAAPLWLPDSVLLCPLLLTPYRRWWSYLAIAFLIRVISVTSSPMPAWFILATTINDLLKATVVAYLLRRMTRTTDYLSSLHVFAIYLLLAVLVTPVLSALGGAATRRVLGYPFWPAWKEWFFGDSLANLVLTPALLCWLSGRWRTWTLRAGESTLWVFGFCLSILAASYLVHSGYAPIALYTPVPFLVWAALRFGTLGASTSLSSIALLSMAGISRGTGPFAIREAADNVLFLQLFLFVISAPVLFIAILFEERNRVEWQLRESRQKLEENYERVRDMAGRVLTAQEDERKRIALELHDDVCQRLSLLAVGLDELELKVDSQLTDESTDISVLKNEVNDALDALRNLSHQLHSSALDQFGLTTGLRGLCRTLSQQRHIEVQFQSNEVTEVPNDVALCLYRVTQEALNNAVKHGKAKQIHVRLEQTQNSLHLTVMDSGAGFDPTASPNGLGLLSMGERLRMAGGTLTVSSSRGAGTLVEAEVKTAIRLERTSSPVAPPYSSSEEPGLQDIRPAS
jgi:two-component system sensor histidine kinase UhpB